MGRPDSIAIAPPTEALAGFATPVAAAGPICNGNTAPTWPTGPGTLGGIADGGSGNDRVEDHLGTNRRL